MKDRCTEMGGARDGSYLWLEGAGEQALTG